jgi:hypothetical protein
MIQNTTIVPAKLEKKEETPVSPFSKSQKSAKSSNFESLKSPKVKTFKETLVRLPTTMDGKAMTRIAEQSQDSKS